MGMLEIRKTPVKGHFPVLNRGRSSLSLTHPMKSLLASSLCLAASALMVCAAGSPSPSPAPKRLLVVTVTLGFRHSSIPTAEKVLSQIAAKSGAFTVDFVNQPEGQPANPGHEPTPPPATATAGEQAAYASALARHDAAAKAAAAASGLWMERVKQALRALSPGNLKNYDGVVFCSTTGDLPIPDQEGFLNWIKDGHAFIGIHAASDTFHHWPGYLDMLGGEFLKHGKQLGVEAINMDPKNPATADLPPKWAIPQEEIYNFKDYDPAKVHELLTLGISPLDGAPGHFPVSWCKMYGKGRVFYTSLGHREDIWDTDPSIPHRINPPEVAEKFQGLLLGGIEWALGLEPRDATPQL
jgi:type 1 glutamine amidotransferase